MLRSSESASHKWEHAAFGAEIKKFYAVNLQGVCDSLAWPVHSRMWHNFVRNVVVVCWCLLRVVWCLLFVVCCCWLLVVGCWLLVVSCCWLLVVGCWLLVVGCWLLWCWLLSLFCVLFVFKLLRWNILAGVLRMSRPSTWQPSSRAQWDIHWSATQHGFICFPPNTYIVRDSAYIYISPYNLWRHEKVLMTNKDNHGVFNLALSLSRARITIEKCVVSPPSKLRWLWLEKYRTANWVLFPLIMYACTVSQSFSQHSWHKWTADESQLQERSWR